MIGQAVKGEEYQMTQWKSDSFILPMKLSNVSGGKGGSAVLWNSRRRLPHLRRGKDGNGIEFYKGENQKGWSGAEYLNRVRSVLMRVGGSNPSIYSTNFSYSWEKIRTFFESSL